MSFGRRGICACAMALACLLGMLAPTTSLAAVYWGSSHNGVGAANLDGENPIWDYLYWPFVDESDGPACGVAVNPTHLYWAGSRGIGRRALEGENVYPTTIVPQLPRPCGLTLDAGHIYWGNSGGGSIGRANLDGSEATLSFITGLELPCDVAVDSRHIYWMERGGIGRANLDGSAAQRGFAPIPFWTGGCGIAIGGRYLYWGQAGTIRRLDLDGEAAAETLVSGVGAVEGITLDDNYMYWANWGEDNVASIGRARLDGSEVNPRWIVSPERQLLGVAVDGRPVPPLLLLPSRPISFAANAEFNLRSGAARIETYVPGQGDLRVTSPGLSWKVFRTTILRPARAGYQWGVRFRAGSGKVGKRIRKQLRARGWAAVTLHIEYTQSRIYPTTASRRFILRRYPGAKARWVKHPRPPRDRLSSVVPPSSPAK